MSFPVILNSQNVVSANTLRVDLPTSIDLSSFECSVGALNIYYSWYNINAFPLKNNSFTLQIPRDGGTDTLTITIPDGAYNISDLNNYLQYRLIAGNYYLVNTATQENLYYAAFELSPTSYQVQLITYPMPTSLPAGYTSPGMTFPASANQHYQFGILGTNDFRNIIGFNVGTYPPSPTNVGIYTKASDNVPNVNPISSVQMRLSCLYNPFSRNSNLLHVFTNGGKSIGELIDASPSVESYVPCEGMHSQLTVSFFDQFGNPLQIIDPNMVIKLNFRKKSAD